MCLDFFRRAACLSPIKNVLYSHFVFEKTAQLEAQNHDPGIETPMLNRLMEPCYIEAANTRWRSVGVDFGNTALVSLL